jgi:hypothetical protein
MSFSELSPGHAQDIARHVTLLEATAAGHPLPLWRTIEGADD